MKKFITIAQFALMLSEINLSTFAQALSQTEPKLNKKSRTTGEPLPFNKVLNCRNINLQLNYDYEAQVIRRDEKQNAGEPSNFEAQEHTWARKVKGALARHKDYAIDVLNVDFNKVDTTKLYMPYVKLRIDSQVYIADGKPIDKETLIDFMPPASNYESQPAEKKVVVEYMKLASIKEFTLSGVEYQII